MPIPSEFTTLRPASTVVITAAYRGSSATAATTFRHSAANRRRDAHAALDSAVRAAYGMAKEEDPLALLLRLNLDCAAKEAAGTPITPPDLPALVADPKQLITDDCIQL